MDFATDYSEIGNDDYYDYLKDEILFLMEVSIRVDRNAIVPIVYTFYGKDREPLYVGSSSNFWERFRSGHWRKSYWEEVEEIGIRAYPDREQMRIAELAWIFIKKPKYNRDGKYENGKKPIYFGTPGITFSDATDEVFYTKQEMDLPIHMCEWSKEAAK